MHTMESKPGTTMVRTRVRTRSRTLCVPVGDEVNEDRILSKLDSIEQNNQMMLIALTRLEEQVRAVPDHEVRLRSLERWKYGLPITGLTAILSIGLSAWTASKGGA